MIQRQFSISARYVEHAVAVAAIATSLYCISLVPTEYMVVATAWFSANALVSINVVTLRRARLILGWVTVCERLNHFGL